MAGAVSRKCTAQRAQPAHAACGAHTVPSKLSVQLAAPQQCARQVTCTAARDGASSARSSSHAAASTSAPSSNGNAVGSHHDDGAESTSRAGAVVGRYYERYNAGDIDGVMACFAEGVVYHDTIYLEPFFGKPALRRFFDEFSKYENLAEMDFQIKEVVTDDESCAIAWQLETDGAFFPFSRGVSFYKVDEDGLIYWGRDCVEAAPPKPGDSTPPLLNALVPVLRKIGVQNADPAQLSELPLAKWAVWLFYAGYIAYILLSTAAPGAPVWATEPRVLQETWHHSLNFFYINVGLKQFGLAPVPSIPENPVGEAVFNFVNAWSLMFLPLLACDRSTRCNVRQWPVQFAGVMFLTNLFFIPLLAQRAAPLPPASGLSSAHRTAASLSPYAASRARDALAKADARDSELAAAEARAADQWRGAGRAIGAISLFVGGLSLAWFALARPEYGGLATRLRVFGERFAEERVFYAFIVDMGLYALWQSWIMAALGAPRRYCAVPFLGQAAWLLQGRPQK